MPDLNFSFSIGPESTGIKVDQPLWSFNGVRFVPGPANTVTLHRTATDARMLVQPELASALQQCSKFRTMEAHATAVIEQAPELRQDPNDVLRTLESVRSAGLFESSEDAWRRVSDTSAQSQLPGCIIFILTCDRPEALARLLDSISASPIPSEAESICVLDDSRKGDCIEKNSKAIAQIRDQFTVPIFHFDAEARHGYLNALRQQTPDSTDAISFLLDRAEWSNHATYGLARNFALLLSAGKRALILDDDIVTEAIAPPLSPSNLSPATANDRQAFFYTSATELAQHEMKLSDSPLQLMLEHLGKSAGEIISSQASNHMDLAGWDGALMETIQPDSRALMTQCGSWGDPGTVGGGWVFFLQNATIRRLVNTSSDLEAVLGARAGWLGYSGPTLSAYGTMSQLTGLSHDALLPPYLPAGRGEDIAFGILVKRLHPYSFVFNHGWAIKHQPLEHRAERGALSGLDSGLGVSSLADLLGEEPYDHWGLPPLANLKAVAEQLARLSEMNSSRLTELVNQRLLRKTSSLLARNVEHIKRLEDMTDMPGYSSWRGFLEQTQEQLLTRIQTPSPEPLATVSQAMGGEEQLRKKGARLANALIAWPSIKEAAETINPSLKP